MNFCIDRSAIPLWTSIVKKISWLKWCSFSTYSVSNQIELRLIYTSASNQTTTFVNYLAFQLPASLTPVLVNSRVGSDQCWATIAFLANVDLKKPDNAFMNVLCKLFNETTETGQPSTGNYVLMRVTHQYWTYTFFGGVQRMMLGFEGEEQLPWRRSMNHPLVVMEVLKTEAVTYHEDASVNAEVRFANVSISDKQRCLGQSWLNRGGGLSHHLSDI